MKTFEHKNGYKGIYDDELKPGDLITTYYKGYYEFVTMEERKDNAPLYYFKLKYDSNGQPRMSKKLQCCDAAYCRLAKNFLEKEIEQRKTQIENLNKILCQLK